MTATNAPSNPGSAASDALSAEQKAHETSMDDILASIRRMISDDDALPLSRSARAAARKAPVDSPPPPPSADAFSGLGHRLGQGAPEDAPPPAAKPAIPPPPALNLRDFAPKTPVATPAVPAMDEARQPPAASPLSAELRPSLEEAPNELQVEPSTESPKSSVVDLSPRLGLAAEQRLKLAPLPFRPPVAPKFVEPAPAEPEPERAPALADHDASLLSPQAGERIGASFEALAETVLARDSALVEKLARDMLRPMLKSWLDDNLPGIVERLVRAEIERVARGRG